MSVISIGHRSESIPCDRNGLPQGHYAALESVIDDFREWVNDLPDSVYFLNREDARELTERLLGRYVRVLPRVRA